MDRDMMRQHSQSRQAKARLEVRAMEWVEVHVTCVVVKDTLPGTVHLEKGAGISRLTSHRVEPRHSSNISKFQLERSMNHGFSSLDSRPRSRHISQSTGEESSTMPYWTPDVNGPSWANVCFRQGWSYRRQPMTCTPLIVRKFHWSDVLPPTLRSTDRSTPRTWLSPIRLMS